MDGLTNTSRFFRSWLCFGVVALCLMLSASTVRGQFWKSLFQRDRPAGPPAPAAEPSPDTSDGGYLAKQRYDNLTRGTVHDSAKLLALVKPFLEKQFPPLKGSAPTIEGAEMVNDDSLCATCHREYVKAHRTDIHRNQACETCHGPGSLHLKTRGAKPGLIISFKTTAPLDQNEICLKCHDQQVKNHFVEPKWRASTHAHAGNACTTCHRNHYTVPAGTKATQTDLDAPELPPQPKETEADVQAIRATYAAQGAPNSQTCLKCHFDNPGAPPEARKIANITLPGAPHQVDGPHHFQCTTCHDPHGVLRKEIRTDLCIQCHQQNPKTTPWHGSSHAKAGMACVDCHNPHSPAAALGAKATATCYKCHDEKAELEQVAHPHQINGVNGFQCGTCHNPHDNIRKETRVDQCVCCHKGHPTMAWKSSLHALYNVTCTDCHNPHPSSKVPAFANIDHNQVDRPRRMPMSVDEPLVCYRCHNQIAAQFNLPFHHPVPEGKMNCSKCHDAHGGASDKNLKEPTVNLTCYKCHSSKQGPFVWEHPPVTEDCTICHNPHGTVTKQLLKQPPTFLCLRCHSGHFGSHHVMIQKLPSHQPAFYTDCVQCHHEVHGSNLPSLERNGPRLQR